MYSLIRNINALLKIGAALVAAVIFLYANFATIKYVDAKYDQQADLIRSIGSGLDRRMDESRRDVDRRMEQFKDSMKDLITTVHTMDGRLYEINGRAGKPPVSKSKL